MSLIADSTQKKPAKQKMTKTQVISLLSSNANLMEEQEDLTDYINSLDWNSGQDVETLRKGYDTFKESKYNKELAAIAHHHGLQTADLKSFVENIMSRMIFDGEKLTDLLESLDLSWKERRVKELALMADLVPQLKKLAQGREISGLAAYD
jgi:type I restriction enzyme R subunit